MRADGPGNQEPREHPTGRRYRVTLSGYQPRPLPPLRSRPERWYARALFALLPLLSVTASCAVGIQVGRVIALFAPLLLALVIGVVSGALMLVLFFRPLPDETKLMDALVAPIVVLILALPLFPVFSKVVAKARHLRERERLHHTPPTRTTGP